MFLNFVSTQVDKDWANMVTKEKAQTSQNINGHYLRYLLAIQRYF